MPSAQRPLPTLREKQRTDGLSGKSVDPAGLGGAGVSAAAWASTQVEYQIGGARARSGARGALEAGPACCGCTVCCATCSNRGLHAASGTYHRGDVALGQLQR